MIIMAGHRPPALLFILTLCCVLAMLEAVCYLVVGVLADKDAIYRPGKLRDVD